MIKIKTVDEILTKLLDDEIEFDRKHHTVMNDCYIFTIQKIAKAMHLFYWKYRKEILRKIHEWAKKNKHKWIDKKGRTWKIGYGQQMHPFYGTFVKDYDIIELWRIK